MDHTRVLLSIKVRAEAKAELAKLAEEMNVTLSDVARMALSKGVREIKSERSRKK